MRGTRGGQSTDRGQSETLGVVLLLGLTVVGTTLVVALGGGALDTAQQATTVQSTEHAMTLLDARSAMVALGQSDVQTVDLGQTGDGAFTVHQDSGWLRIRHVNYTANKNETVFNRSLGSLVYTSGDTEIAYQGGGVWRIDGNGSARMVSPPEFHYRDATLTLPIIRVHGSTSGGGDTRAVITRTERARRVFPNASAHYPTGRSYENPVGTGTLQVTVHSRYYRGWAQYFRARTEGNVSVDRANQTATAELVAVGIMGAFQMPQDGNAIELRGLGNDHSIDNFTVTINPDQQDNANFANLDWSLDAQSGSQSFNVTLLNRNGKICSGGNADVILTYEGSSGTQKWVETSAFTENATQFSYSCAGGKPTLSMNLTSTEQLNYTQGPSNLQFTQHPVDKAVTYDPGVGDTEAVGYLVNHYLSLMGPNVNLVVDDSGNGNGNGHNAAGSVDESLSYGNLVYGGDGRSVTFLHVTENDVVVRLR